MADAAPPDAALVRAQSIARLKRAASLPRVNGRRPSAAGLTAPPPAPGEPSPSASTTSSSLTASPYESATPSISRGRTGPTTAPTSAEGQDAVASWFSHDPSARDSIGPPPTFDDSSAGAAAAEQTGQELPDDTPLASFNSSPSLPMLLNRSVSSSLLATSSDPPRLFPQVPSLQHIQSRHLLQRSNSAAARMTALSKLTGGAVPTMPVPLPPPTILRSTSVRRVDIENEDEGVGASEGSPPATGRPRLRRSHTVGGGDGEERRSVVGRKMMLRLGNRVASPSKPGAGSAVAAAGLDTKLQTAGSSNNLQSNIGAVSSSSSVSASGSGWLAPPPAPFVASSHHDHSDEDSQEILHQGHFSIYDPSTDPIEPTMTSSAASSIHSSPHVNFSSLSQLRTDRLSFASSAASGSTRDHTLLGGAGWGASSAAGHGGSTEDGHVDAFEFAEHLRRTNSGRTVRTISPMPPMAGRISGVPTSLLSSEAGSSPPPMGGDAPLPLDPASSSGAAFQTPPRTSYREYQAPADSPDTPGGGDGFSPSIPILPPGPSSTDSHDGGTGEEQQRVRLDSFPASISGGGGGTDGSRASSWMQSPMKDDRGGRDTPRLDEGSYHVDENYNEDDQTTPLPLQGQFASSLQSQDAVSPQNETSMLSIFPTVASHEQNGSWQQREPQVQTRERILTEGETQKSRAVSEMSWEEVGGPADREVPTDERYLRKADSLAGKLERIISKGTYNAGSSGGGGSRSRSGSVSHTLSPAGGVSLKQTTSSLTRSPEKTQLDLPVGSRTLSKTASATSFASSGSSHERRRGSESGQYDVVALSPVSTQHQQRGRDGSPHSYLPQSPGFSIGGGGPGSPLIPASPSETKYAMDPKLMAFPGIARLEQERADRKLRAAAAASVDSPGLAVTVGSPFPNSPALGEGGSPSQQSYFDLTSRPSSPTSEKDKSSKSKSWLAKKFSNSGLGSASKQSPASLSSVSSLSLDKSRPSLPDLNSMRRHDDGTLPSPPSPPVGIGLFPIGVSAPVSNATSPRTSTTPSTSPVRRSSVGATSELAVRSFVQHSFPTSPSPPMVSTETHTPPPRLPSVGAGLSRFDAMSPPRISTVAETSEEGTPRRERLTSLGSSNKSAQEAAVAAAVTAAATAGSVALGDGEPKPAIPRAVKALLSEEFPELAAAVVPSPYHQRNSSFGDRSGSDARSEASSSVAAPLFEGSSQARFVESFESPEEEGFDERGGSVIQDWQSEERGSGTTPADAGSATIFPPKTSVVFGRLNSILSTAPVGGPSQLDDPPRKLLLHIPVLQVVNHNTVKDRFLFLFTDLLVIAKPILGEGELPSLEKKFIVKSIVELHKLKLTNNKEDEGAATGNLEVSDAPTKQHPIVTSFIIRFARDPAGAVAHLVDKSSLEDDNVSSLLFKTPELDKAQLGDFLSRRSSMTFLQGFVGRFPFGGVRIDEALRIFLLALRLPSDVTASETLLQAFAAHWHAANQSQVSFDCDVATRLVLATLQLNDALNPTTGTSGFGTFAFANSSITADDFTQAFYVRDSERRVGAELLGTIYDSIKRERLSQALTSTEVAEVAREVTQTPAKLTSRLTYKIPSETVTLRIPAPDRNFSIRLHGAGLVITPPVLSFANTNLASFTVTGTSLGQKTLLFSRAGANAALYPSLPATKTFIVERMFMRVGHCFQLSFIREPSGTKRKYLFSFEHKTVRQQWAAAIDSQIRYCVAAHEQEQAAAASSTAAVPAHVKAAASTVALQVLRDALIPLSTEAAAAPAAGSNVSRGFSAASLASANARRAGAARPGGAVATRQGVASASRPGGVALVRSASSSVVYARTSGRAETELDSQLEQEREKNRQNSSFGRARPSGGRGAAAAAAVDPVTAVREAEQQAATSFLKAQTGREIAILCEQNSLIPLALSFLQAGMPSAVLPTPNSSVHSRRPSTGTAASTSARNRPNFI